MVDYKVSVFNAARDNNLVALKVSAFGFSIYIYIYVVYVLVLHLHCVASPLCIHLRPISHN